jgi:hypothetical protein
MLPIMIQGFALLLITLSSVAAWLVLFSTLHIVTNPTWKSSLMTCCVDVLFILISSIMNSKLYRYLSVLLNTLGLQLIFLALAIIYYFFLDLLMLASYMAEHWNSVLEFTESSIINYVGLETSLSLMGSTLIAPGTAEYIPWSHTQSLQNGIIALNKMYEHLDDGSAVKDYINQHCLFLLSELKGFTNIPVSNVDIDLLEYNANTVNLKNSYSTTYTSSLDNQSGVYIF